MRYIILALLLSGCTCHEIVITDAELIISEPTIDRKD